MFFQQFQLFIIDQGTIGHQGKVNGETTLLSQLRGILNPVFYQVPRKHGLSSAEEGNHQLFTTDALRIDKLLQCGFQLFFFEYPSIPAFGRITVAAGKVAYGIGQNGKPEKSIGRFAARNELFQRFMIQQGFHGLHNGFIGH
ncbi:hypothetical protein DSECCO2_319850 [anaerobic digester metagenome]